MKLRHHIVPASFVIIVITFVLFVVALFTRGLTQAGQCRCRCKPHTAQPYP